MLNLPILRWGQAYTSLEQDTVAHFLTGETLAKVSQANTGLLGRDMRQAARARQALTEIPIAELIEMMKKAGDLYLNGTLAMGDTRRALGGATLAPTLRARPWHWRASSSGAGLVVSTTSVSRTMTVSRLGSKPWAA